MERMHCSFHEALATPNEVIERAFIVWQMDAQRDTLKSSKQ